MLRYQLHGTLEYINNKNTKRLRILEEQIFLYLVPLKNIADMDIHDLKSFFLDTMQYVMSLIIIET